MKALKKILIAGLILSMLCAPFTACRKAPAEAELLCTVTLKGLSEGCKGNAVKALQILLAGYGYSCGICGVDSSFGPDTKNAVKAFQKDFNLEDDGIVGHQTWAKLLGV